MVRKHLNSEKKINNNYFKLKFGTTNSLNPIAIYIEGKTFLQPTIDKSDYNEDINELKNKLRILIRDTLIKDNKFFNKDNYILDFDVANSGLIKNKKSFLTIQIFLKQKGEVKFVDLYKSTCDDMNDLMNKFSMEVFNHNFLLCKSK